MGIDGESARRMTPEAQKRIRSAHGLKCPVCLRSEVHHTLRERRLCRAQTA